MLGPFVCGVGWAGQPRLMWRAEVMEEMVEEERTKDTLWLKIWAGLPGQEHLERGCGGPRTNKKHSSVLCEPPRN